MASDHLGRNDFCDAGLAHHGTDPRLPVHHPLSRKSAKAFANTEIMTMNFIKSDVVRCSTYRVALLGALLTVGCENSNEPEISPAGRYGATTLITTTNGTTRMTSTALPQLVQVLLQVLLYSK